jgi:5'(3')-deoxyribonucleotidase
MEILKTIAIDIRESVFENDTEGILYITKDIYSDSYIISVPVWSFSAILSYESETEAKRDYNWIKEHFPSFQHRENLVQAIKEAIEEF